MNLPAALCCIKSIMLIAYPAKSIKLVEFVLRELESEVFEEWVGQQLVAAPSFHWVLVQAFLQTEKNTRVYIIHSNLCNSVGST